MTQPAPLASSRILVVDDAPCVLELLETTLAGAGAIVKIAADGPSALAAVEKEPPDLILLDVRMPGMDGWDVLKHLATSHRTARIPVALETSAEDYTSLDHARREGVAAFISKPFRLPEVVETCRRILKGARPLQGQGAHDEPSVPVQVRDASGNLLMIGVLLDLDARGAQVDLSGPIPLSQSVMLTLLEESGERSLPAVVRWVTALGGRYQLGLALRPSAPGV